MEENGSPSDNINQNNNNINLNNSNNNMTNINLLNPSKIEFFNENIIDTIEQK